MEQVGRVRGGAGSWVLSNTTWYDKPFCQRRFDENWKLGGSAHAHCHLASGPLRPCRDLDLD